MVYNFGTYDGTFVGKNNDNPVYQVWVGMIKRCYSQTNFSRSPTYINTTVCDEWSLYSNFEMWYNANHIDGFFLDKDIIGGSTNTYSPLTCAFVPRELNNSILDRKSESPYLIGVCYHKKKKDMINEYKKPFYAQLNSKPLGSYETEYEAHRAWQCGKIQYFNELIEKYKGSVDVRIIEGVEKRIHILEKDITDNAITKTVNKI